MERVVGPNALIASLCNGITSEQRLPNALAGSIPFLVSARAWTPCSQRRAHLYQCGRDALARRPARTATVAYRRAHTPAASPIPSRTTSLTACGPNSCSTTASTRPAWPTAGPTEAPRSRARAASLLCFRHARNACGRQRRGR
ncbi:MAG: hypothetical protein ACLTYW_04750 [Collinsella sp.]